MKMMQPVIELGDDQVLDTAARLALLGNGTRVQNAAALWISCKMFCRRNGEYLCPVNPPAVYLTYHFAILPFYLFTILPFYHFGCVCVQSFRAAG